jgi:aminopeptidase-like protein
MTFTDLNNSIDPEQVGQEMYSLIEELFPICRSITGDGVRQTLRRVQQTIPLTIQEVPTGMQVFDWTVPKEWNIRDAYIKDSRGKKIVDFQKSSLHVLNYSVPINKVVSLAELKEHLFTLPTHPDWIPYRTSYYKESWGFCLSHNQFTTLEEDNYEVLIDSTLENGSLTYGELCLQGEQEEEVLISCHVCHPSLANDNLSGVSLSTMLAKCLAATARYYSYRFLFIPGTIGAITWLALNEARISKITHGLVVACVGDRGGLTYKKSRRGDADIDRTVAHVLRHFGGDYEIVDFSPYGYDERQFCSPAFNLPMGSLARTPHGRFPEYHTSADNIDLVQPEYLANSLAACLSVVWLLERDKRYLNLSPKCEPQLGRRGLYADIGGSAHGRTSELAMLWTLNLSDGEHTLLDIADRAGLPFDVIHESAILLHSRGLLRVLND